MPRIYHVYRIAAMILVLQHAAFGSARAQVTEDSEDPIRREIDRRVPVTLALVDNRHDARATILRRATMQPRDVIVLRRDASADDLTQALFVLLVARARTGDTVSRDFQLRVDGSAEPNPWRAKQSKRAQRLLKQLHHSEGSTVEGLGPARVYEIYLKARAFEQKLR